MTWFYAVFFTAGGLTVIGGHISNRRDDRRQR